MLERRLDKVLCAIVITAACGACAKEETQPPPVSVTSANANAANESGAQTFRFAPPDGTQFIRKDRSRQERVIAGSSLRSVEEEALDWKVEVHRKGEQVLVDQRLDGVSLKEDGNVLVEGKAARGIDAELVIDRNGKLVDVKGLDETAARLKELASPQMKDAVEQVFTKKHLYDSIATRYAEQFGDTIGHPSAPGSTWTIKNPAGSFVASKKVTVERNEPCGLASCARLRVDYEIDPRVMSDGAVALVKARVKAAGGDPARVSLKRASYGASGSMLIEPATMLSHGATLRETGSVTLAAPDGGEVTVQINGTTDAIYDYLPPRVASVVP